VLSCDFVSLCVCVRALNEKRFELSTSNLVHILGLYFTAVARHAGGQNVKGQGRTVMKTLTVARLLVCCCGRVLLLPAWDCTSYDFLGF